jgi:hypothetical protein
MNRAALLLLAASVLIVPVLAQETTGTHVSGSAGPFTLGVLRRDGIVVPFAAYDGRRWQGPWPADLAYRELPISFESIDRDWWGRVPPPQSMTLWADGKPRGDLKLLAPVFLRLPCTRRIGVSTNYHPAEVPPAPTVQPFPKDGLVVSGGQTIGVIETVPEGAPERLVIAKAVAEELGKEEDVASRQFINWRHPFSRAERRKFPIEVEALYRAPMDEPGWTAHYVELVRRYPPGPDDDDCGLLTSARGWVRTGPKGQTRVALGSQISYCDRYGISFMLPLGLIKVSSGTYWIYQVAGYEQESYMISKPTARTEERILAYPAVACPVLR